MVAYLTDENGLIHVRNKEVKIRPLDKEKIKTELFGKSLIWSCPLPYSSFLELYALI